MDGPAVRNSVFSAGHGVKSNPRPLATGVGIGVGVSLPEAWVGFPVGEDVGAMDRCVAGVGEKVGVSVSP